MKNQILFDKSAETFIRDALGLAPEGKALAYIKDKSTGKIKEVTSEVELLFLESDDDALD